MSRNEFLELINKAQYSELEIILRKKITIGNFDSQDIKYLAVALEKQNKLNDAICYLKIAERVNQSDDELIEILAFTYDKISEPLLAIHYFKKLLDKTPENWLFNFRVGVNYEKLNDYSNSIKYLIASRNLKPEFLDNYNYLYRVFHKLEKLSESEFVLSEALRFAPNSAHLHLNAGVVASNLSKFEKAIHHLQKSVEIQPSPGGYLNLGNLYKQIGEIEQSINYTFKSVELNSQYALGYNNLCIDHNYFWAPKKQTFDIAKKYGELVKVSNPYKSWNCNLLEKRKLRIGFVSGDFRAHPVSHFLCGILDSISKDEFHLVGYYNSEIITSMTDRISKKFEEWYPGVNKLSDSHLAKKIHEDNIDILIDLSGHTAKNRLPVFAYRPAPIQATWLGYFNTTGLEEINWIIADKTVLPLRDKKYFTEKPYYMPSIYYAYTKPELDILIEKPPVLKNNYITFGSFNNYPKINHKVIKCWSSLLKKIPTSKLLIKNRQIKDDYLSNKLSDQFLEYGILKDRLIFEGVSPRMEYFRDFNKIDIALDPFPFPGGTTTIDCLWMGVPVINLSGNTFISRQGETILSNVGLKKWVAYSEDEYIQIAINKSTQIDELISLRKNLRQMIESSPVMDTKAFASNLSIFFKNAWLEYVSR